MLATSPRTSTLCAEMILHLERLDVASDAVGRACRAARDVAFRYGPAGKPAVDGIAFIVAHSVRSVRFSAV